MFLILAAPIPFEKPVPTPIITPGVYTIKWWGNENDICYLFPNGEFVYNYSGGSMRCFGYWKYNKETKTLGWLERYTKELTYRKFVFDLAWCHEEKCWKSQTITIWRHECLSSKMLKSKSK